MNDNKSFIHGHIACIRFHLAWRDADYPDTNTMLKRIQDHAALIRKQRLANTLIGKRKPTLREIRYGRQLQELASEVLKP